MKAIQMLLYAEPGLGKSVFAYRLGEYLKELNGGKGRTYFICSDGNYQWLEDFGAKDEDHVQVTSYEQFQLVCNNLPKDATTIVVDLLEDILMYCTQDFLKANKLTHIGDLPYAKGYDITRTDFIITISKLIGSGKNIILLSHETAQVYKDKRGVEHTKYTPSSRLPEKVLNQLSGKLRYVLRAFYKTDIEDDKLVTRRMLSISKKEDEFSNIRGVDMNMAPDMIPLEPQDFIETIESLKPTLGSVVSSVKITKKDSEKSIEKSVVKPTFKPSINIQTKPVEKKSEEVKVAPTPVVKTEKQSTNDGNTYFISKDNTPIVATNKSEITQCVLKGCKRISKQQYDELITVNKNVSPDVSEDVSPDVSENVKETVAENINDKLYYFKKENGDVINVKGENVRQQAIDEGLTEITKEEKVVEMPKKVEVATKESQPQPKKSNDDFMAALQAKLAALKNKK